MKRLMTILFITTMLMFSSCEFALAKDLVGPPAPPAGQYLSVHYSPSGGIMAFLDSTNDGVCDHVMIYGFLPAEERQVYLRTITCAEGQEVFSVAQRIWERRGYVPMVYDKDKSRLVPVE